jgi:hypothetical protein
MHTLNQPSHLPERYAVEITPAPEQRAARELSGGGWRGISERFDEEQERAYERQAASVAEMQRAAAAAAAADPEDAARM